MSNKDIARHYKMSVPKLKLFWFFHPSEKPKMIDAYVRVHGCQ